jgi:hypothetical protein
MRGLYTRAMDPPDFELSLPGFLRRQAERFGDRELVVLGERRLGALLAARLEA